jgi:signal transduction histidine kinase
MAALFNDAPDAVFILDAATYSIADCNQKALEIFETETKSNIVGLPSFRLYESEPTDFSRDLLESNMRNAGEHTQEMNFRTFKQNVFWGKLTKRTVKYEEKEYIILRISKAIDYLKTEETLSMLMRGTAKVTGKKFFKELTKLLCKTFDVNLTLVAKLSNDKKRLEVVEYCGPLAKNSTPINNSVGSVFENVKRGFTTFYPSGCRDLFPEDTFVAYNKIEGFMGTPVFGNSGDVIGMIALMHNKPLQEVPNSRYVLSFFASRTAAEFHRLRSKALLKEQARELASANQVKDRLISVMSHDLMNPLHSVMGYSELLRTRIDKYPKERIIESVDLIDNSIKNIYFLLENIKDWSNLSKENIKTKTERITVEDTVSDILNLYKYIIRIKELDVSLTVNRTNPLTTDKHMFESIVRNLVSNSIKHTPKGGAISIVLGTNDKYFEFELHDNGIGFQQDEIRHLFGPEVSNIDPIYLQRLSGDLGMSLTKHYVTRLKGSLTIETPSEGRSICKVQLPFNIQ